MILLIDIAVFVPTFIAAAYLGANIAISLSCGFVVVSIVNLIGAAINLGGINRRRHK